MKRTLFSCLALSFCASGTALADSEGWPKLFREAVTPASQISSYSFEALVIDQDFEAGEKLRYRINNSSSGRQVELFEIPSDLKEKDLIQKLSESDGEIWCDDYREHVSGDVTLMAEDDQTATFAFMLNPETATEKTEKKIFKKTQMTVTVDKADKWVTGFTYKLLEPVKPMVVAKVREFSLVGECARSESGRPHVVSVETRVSGSAMGASFNQVQNQTISNVTLLD